MKSLFAAVLILVTVTTSSNSDPKMVKRQAPSLQLQIGVGPNRETYLATMDDERIVALTGASTGTVCLSSGQNLRYTGGTGGSVVISGTEAQTIPVKRYEQLVGSQREIFTTSPSSVQNTQGCLYYDNCTAFFTTSSILTNFIASNRPNFPVPNVDIALVRRGDTLQVNVDQTPDGVSSSEDDVVNLRGAESFNLRADDTIIYNNDRVTIFEGSSISREVDDVDEFHVIEDVDGAGGGGPTVRVFMNSAASLFAGPGTVYIGFNDANQRVICLIKSQNVSEQLGSDLVSMQIVANQSGVLTDSFTGQRLIDLRNSQEFSFETASRIEYKNGIVNIYNSFGNLLRVFGSQTMPISLSSFFNNQAEIIGSTESRNFSVPSGGVVLYYNSQDSRMFAYPSSNRFLAAGIQLAIMQVNSTSVSALPINLRLDITDLGQGTLSLDGQPVLLATNSRNTTLPPNSIVAMPSREEIQVSQNNILLRRPVRSVQMATAVTGSTLGNVFTPELGQTIPLQRGGTLYTDVNNNVLVASRSSGIQPFISEATEDIPLLRVNVRNSMVNSQPHVSLSSSGTSVANATNSETFTTTQNQRIVYLNGSVNAATASRVSSTALVLYNASVPAVQIIDTATRTPILQTRINGPFLTPRLTATTARIEAVSGDTVLQGGGVYYMGKTGAAYLPSDLIDSVSLQALNSINALDKCIENVRRVTIFHNGRLTFFRDGSFYSLPGNGTAFINGDHMFHTTDRTLVQQIFSANSRAFPLQLECDDEGRVIISRNGIVIYSFDLSSSVFDLGDTNVVQLDEMILTSPAFSSNFTPILSIIVYDGLSNDTLDSPAVVTGSGLIIIDKQLESAFFTSDGTSVTRIKNFLANKRSVLRAPDIEDARPLSFASVQGIVDGRFGQIITAIVGSVVNLRCIVAIANPPATFTFSQRDRNNASVFISLDSASDAEVKRNGLNDFTLQITRVSAGETEYRCDAKNVLSTATAYARIVGVAGRAPEIRNNYFTRGISLGTAVVTAQTGQLPMITPLINFSDVDDRTQIKDRVIIGCRAKGRPVPEITWSTMPPNRINFSLSVYNLSSPGPGQSLISVALPEDDVQCVTYICTASNAVGSQNGSARVCPQTILRQSNPARITNCSSECGIGTLLRFFNYDRTFDGGQEVLTFEELPAGLVKPESRFCVNPPCPMVIYQFETSNYTNCSRFCETGQQSRNVTCVRKVGNEVMVMDDSECIYRGVQKPPSRRNCNTFPCPEYVVTDFGPCSRTCRGGVTTRNVTCEMVDLDEQGMFEVSNKTEVPLEICERYSQQVKPEELVRCNGNIRCPVRFLPSEFGPCDQFNCQERSFMCVNFDPHNPAEAWPTDDVVCEDQGLMRIQPVRSCGNGPCNFGQWRSTPLQVCNAPCGYGVQNFRVVCLNRTTDEVIDNGYCNSNTRPKHTDTCFLRNCPGSCQEEPLECQSLAIFRACKMVERFPVIKSCCKSCPSQATPIPLL